MAEGQRSAGDRPRRGGVIFDVDGTLLDTNYQHVTAWWEAFRERGHDVACADIHRAIGLSSDDLITRVLGRPDPSVSGAHSRYIAPYLGRMRPLAGAPELVRATARRGLNVVLATSAKDEELDLMLDALGARDALDTVVSSGDVKQAKPHPEIVNQALEESGTNPARAVMVGDTVWDVLAAQRAGLPCVGLLSGGIGEDELRSAGAAETYQDPAALLEKLEGSAIGRLGAS
jgi:phosphoglycolate phosphatase-like HAD superfamily hydrolase